MEGPQLGHHRTERRQFFKYNSEKCTFFKCTNLNHDKFELVIANPRKLTHFHVENDRIHAIILYQNSEKIFAIFYDLQGKRVTSEKEFTSDLIFVHRTDREIFLKCYEIKPKSDCI